MVCAFGTFRRLRHGAPVIGVSGLPRSGTSMAMRMLQAAGVPLMEDGERGADEDNPLGYFEDERVKGLEALADKTWLRGGRGRAIKIISFLLKDLPRDNNYAVVFMQRDLPEVLASQRKMLERRGEDGNTSDQRMTEVYQDHLWRVRYLLGHDAAFCALYLPYREVLAGPAGQAARMADFFGLPETVVPQMAAAVDQRLYRNRAVAAGQGTA